MKGDKMKKAKSIAAALIAATLIVTGCAKSSDSASSGSTDACAKVNSEGGMCGDISTSKSYGTNSTINIRGAVKIKSGNTLTIGAGSTIKADTSTLTYLLIERGATINAVGTFNSPIVFTSGGSVGSRNPSDWGGVVIHGKSATNNTAGLDYAADSEIFTGPYGCGEAGNACAGTLGNNDSSGTLQYVRIEFAGREISAGKEFNGLFLAGVGKGTTINHVQFHRGSDDGMEIFGGAVDVTYAMISDNQDDAFDVDEGWRGSARYIVAAVPKDGDQGIEYDGIGADTSRSTNVPLSNFTIIGSINKTVPGAISVRASGTMSLYNSYIAHFHNANGIIAVAANSITNANTGTPTAGYGTVAAGGFDMRFQSNFIECAYNDGAFTTAKATLDSLFCSGANQPNGCTASNIATTFPDGNTNNDISGLSCAAPKLARPGDGVLWGRIPPGGGNYGNDVHGPAGGAERNRYGHRDVYRRFSERHRQLGRCKPELDGFSG
jgi:hypothetical protein